MTCVRRFPLVTLLVVCLLLAGCGDGDGSVSVDTTVDVPQNDESPETTGPPETAAPPAADHADVERRMERVVFDLVNQERRERGLEPLAWDEQLAERAREWSRQMAEAGALEHQDPRQMLEQADELSGVGENIFRATGAVPASTVHVGWMRSEGHRVNVLRPEFDRLGVGFVCTEEGEVFATQRFGRSGPPAAGGTDEEEVPPEEPVVAEEGQGPSCAAT